MQAQEQLLSLDQSWSHLADNVSQAINQLGQQLDINSYVADYEAGATAWKKLKEQAIKLEEIGKLEVKLPAKAD